MDLRSASAAASQSQNTCVSFDVCDGALHCPHRCSVRDTASHDSEYVYSLCRARHGLQILHIPDCLKVPATDQEINLESVG